MDYNKLTPGELIKRLQLEKKLFELKHRLIINDYKRNKEKLSALK